MTVFQNAPKNQPPPKVMVIGDSEAFISEVAALLQSQGMETTRYGNQSWQMANLDKTMPGAIIVEGGNEEQGWQIGSRIRHDSDVPIIMLGNANSEMAWAKAASYGIDCYLSRPFSPRELLARIRSLIRRHENSYH